MIFDMLFWLAGTMLWLLSSLLATVSFVFPIQIQDAIIYFMGYLNYLNGFIDINTLLTAIGVYILAFSSIYLIKTILWAWGHMPWIGKHIKLPTQKHHKNQEL